MEAMASKMFLTSPKTLNFQQTLKTAPSSDSSSTCHVAASSNLHLSPSPSLFPLSIRTLKNLQTPRNSVKPSKRLSNFTPLCARKKGMFDDPFNYGDDPDMSYGDLLSEGRQQAEAPRPPNDETSDQGYLKFPSGYLPEIASLGLYIRDDVRKCAIFVTGGVYENLLFFPVIQLLKDRYPGVEVDIISTPRGKQTYEMNKNVRRSWVYDVEDVLVMPADYVEMLGRLKNECYDMLISTRQSGLGHALMLFLTDARQRLSYVQPNANGAGAGAFLSKTFRADTINLPERGYYLYKELTDHFCLPSKFTTADDSPLSVPPLKVGISKKVDEVARGVLSAAGIKGPGFVVFHGVESTSAASMRSQGDSDSQLSVEIIAQLAKSTGEEVLVIVPNDRDRAKVAAAVGPNVKIARITTPGQLGAVIANSLAVVTSNTAALQLAMALDKPTVALFGSAEKAELFAPGAKSKNVAIIASKTGKLENVDVKAAVVALAVYAKEGEAALA